MAEEKIVLEGQSRRAIERIGHFGPTKIALDESVGETTRKIARSYGRAWQVLSGEAKAMSKYAAEQVHATNGMSPRDVAKLDRVDRVLHTLERQVRDLDKFAGVQVLGGANRIFRRDIDTVLNSISNITGLDRRFTKPSGAAIEAIVLRNAGRIESATRRLAADQATALKDGLLRGLAFGENPNETARRIYTNTEGAFFGGLTRARTLARTEMADAHRAASKLAYNESDVVTGWKWHAQLSPRTCPACWSLHNTFHPKTETQWAHANCRCTMIPILEDDDPADIDLGDPEEIFWGLPRDQQLQIMGPGRLKALEGGVRWQNLNHLKHNPDWRPAYQVTRVSDLAGLADLEVATVPGDVITIPGHDNASILSTAYQQGGLTIHALTGEQPTSGFVVARQGTSEVIEAREFYSILGTKRMADWMRRHGDRLDEPGAHVGLWHDTANGKVVLDVVEILKDRDAAIALGRAEDQIAIFDLDTFTEIDTGGTGGYATNLSTDLGKVDVGREAVITRGGGEVRGTIVAAGEWGIRIKTADGEFVNAAPGQFVFESGVTQSRIEEIIALQKVMANADHGIKVDYSGASVKSAQEMDDALDDLTGDWSGIKPERIEVRSNAGGAYATTHTSFPTTESRSWIEVDESHAGNYSMWSDSMHSAEQRGHFHRGTSDEPAEYTIDHEFGHVADFKLLGNPATEEGKRRRNELLADIYNSVMADQLAKDAERLGIAADQAKVQPEVMDQIWRYDTAFLDAITSDLSYYATQSQFELVAEGFAVYRDHGPGESKTADTVMKHLVSAYLAKFGEMPSEEDIEELIGL